MEESRCATLVAPRTEGTQESDRDPDAPSFRQLAPSGDGRSVPPIFTSPILCIWYLDDVQSPSPRASAHRLAFRFGGPEEIPAASRPPAQILAQRLPMFGTSPTWRLRCLPGPSGPEGGPGPSKSSDDPLALPLVVRMVPRFVPASRARTAKGWVSGGQSSAIGPIPLCA